MYYQFTDCRVVHAERKSIMPNYRRGRVNEEISRELAQILREIKDPRVSTAFISVTAVDCTADLRSAKVFYSSMGGKDSAEGVAKGLGSAAGFIRRELAARLNMRQTPELRFIRDGSIEHGAHIAELLKSVEEDLRDPEPDAPDDEDTDSDDTSPDAGDTEDEEDV